MLRGRGNFKGEEGKALFILARIWDLCTQHSWILGGSLEHLGIHAGISVSLGGFLVCWCVMKEHCLGEDVKHTGISEGDKFVGRGFQGMLGFLMELHERELGGTGTAEREMLWVTPLLPCCKR